MLDRRAFLGGLFAAPAIVAATSIMPVRLFNPDIFELTIRANAGTLDEYIPTSSFYMTPNVTIREHYSEPAGLGTDKHLFRFNTAKQAKHLADRLYDSDDVHRMSMWTSRNNEGVISRKCHWLLVHKTNGELAEW